MTIGVVGLGLIGGSLALALRAAGERVVGIEPDARARGEALARGAVDEASASPSLLDAAEVVILALPLGLMVREGSPIVRGLRPGTLVTDTASVKREVVEALEAARPEGVTFVGGHPMFGVERRGIEAASAELVRCAPFIFTPTSDASESAVKRLSELAASIQMRTILLSPEEHDRRLAVLSHLPQLLAIALSLSTDDTSCAGPSFRGATRTAMSPPHMLSNIIAMNRGALSDAVASLVATLGELVAAPPERLEERLEEARRRRFELEEATRGV